MFRDSPSIPLTALAAAMLALPAQAQEAPTPTSPVYSRDTPVEKLVADPAAVAVLNMDEIMDAATDGNYKLNVGFQYPNQPSYTDAGKETYDQRNTAKAKALDGATICTGTP